jgi:hypothetical protein
MPALALISTMVSSNRVPAVGETPSHSVTASAARSGREGSSSPPVARLSIDSRVERPSPSSRPASNSESSAAALRPG